MTDEPIDTGDEILDLLAFAVVSGIAIGATLFSFRLCEETRRNDRDRGGSGRG